MQRIRPLINSTCPFFSCLACYLSSVSLSQSDQAPFTKSWGSKSLSGLGWLSKLSPWSSAPVQVNCGLRTLNHLPALDTRKLLGLVGCGSSAGFQRLGCPTPPDALSCVYGLLTRKISAGGTDLLLLGTLVCVMMVLVLCGLSAGCCAGSTE